MTPPALRRYIELKNFWLKNRETTWKALEALAEIKEQKLYLQECKTWEEWCDRHAGRTAASIGVSLRRLEYRKAEELIRETTGESVEKAVVLRKVPAKKVPIKQVRELVQQIQAEVVIDVPQRIEHPARSAAPMDIRLVLMAIESDLDKLIHRNDIPYEAFRLIHKLAAEVSQARTLLQGVLPGFEEMATKKRCRRPTIDEVHKLFMELGLPGGDANWFWEKMEGCGWKNDGKPVVSWEMTVRAWKRHGGIFPSMKTVAPNGSMVAKGKSLAAQDMERLQREVARL